MRQCRRQSSKSDEEGSGEHLELYRRRRVVTAKSLVEEKSRARFAHSAAHETWKEGDVDSVQRSDDMLVSNARTRLHSIDDAVTVCQDAAARSKQETSPTKPRRLKLLRRN